MKKAVLLLFVLVGTFVQAQEFKQIPLINVVGEGKIKVIPDQVSITIAVETKGSKAIDVKKENDAKMDAVLKFIKKSNIAKEDYQTQRVALNPNYDYEKKKQNYIANQTVKILLKDLSKYEEFMEGIVNLGSNAINSVEFKTSTLLQLQSETRKLAMKEAKKKADDYVSILNQKVGKVFTITDNTQNFYPQPILYRSMKAEMVESSDQKETLAIGEIEIISTVNVSFILD